MKFNNLDPKILFDLQLLGQNIKEARQRRGLKQDEMSEMSGVGRKTLGNIEKGDPAVSMGLYLMIMSTLQLNFNLASLASITNDPNSRLSLPDGKKRVRKKNAIINRNF